jgi:hypothetical protein
LQSFFGVGSVYTRLNRKISVYRVTNVKDINDKIIPHFSKYPLISQKRADFLLWSKVVQMMTNKDHLNLSGFLTILTYYASINRGMSKKVLKHYPNIIPYTKPTFDLPDQLNPY